MCSTWCLMWAWCPVEVELSILISLINPSFPVEVRFTHEHNGFSNVILAGWYLFSCILPVHLVVPLCTFNEIELLIYIYKKKKYVFSNLSDSHTFKIMLLAAFLTFVSMWYFVIVVWCSMARVLVIATRQHCLSQ